MQTIKLFTGLTVLTIFINCGFSYPQNISTTVKPQSRKGKLFFNLWIPLGPTGAPGGGNVACQERIAVPAPCSCGIATCGTGQVCISPMTDSTCTTPAAACPDMGQAMGPCKCGTTICFSEQVCDPMASTCGPPLQCNEGEVLAADCLCGDPNHPTEGVPCLMGETCTRAPIPPTPNCNLLMACPGGPVGAPCMCGSGTAVCANGCLCDTTTDMCTCTRLGR